MHTDRTGIEAEAAAPRPTDRRLFMPAIWITDRPTRRPPSRPAEAPRLELPLPRPSVEQAKPRQETPSASEEPERGVAIVDFYL